MTACQPQAIWGRYAPERGPQNSIGATMSRRCELTGKGVLVGNNVSHSQRKTRRRFLPNLQVVSLHSATLDRTVRLRVSARALRTVDHCGGLDAYLCKTNDDSLSVRARRIKRDIRTAELAAAQLSAEAQPAEAAPPVAEPA